MVTLPRLLALALVGSLVGACSSRDTLLEGGAAGAALGGTQASSGNAGAAPSGGKTANGGAPQGAGGSTAGSAAGGPAERGGAAGEVSGGAGTGGAGGAGGAASCALPEGCPPCSDLTTLDDCTAQADCHPVFVDPNTCGCGLNGCCARFSHCANGATASCTFPEPVTCAMVMPFCDSPAYVNSFENGCYSGCVRSSDCTPLP
ncbi:MAG TPA: hypothetical protein VHP33_25185 [Polyangiaceae bacterium]|nr:hypothetical protein [Polyangiaceae bacterium]